MGAAIATVASQGISFLTALWFLHKRGFHFEFSRKDVRLKGYLARKVLTLGAPIALQDALINIFSFVFCINSWFSGQGNSLFPMIHSMIATFFFRIPLSWLCSHLDPGSLVWMGYAPPFSTMISLIICLFYIRYWEKKKLGPKPGMKG